MRVSSVSSGSIRWPLLLTGLVLLSDLVPVASVRADDPRQTAREVRALLSDTCFKCHGPAEQKGGMRLDQEASATKPAESGDIAVVPGKPDESELVRRIFSNDPNEMMPPPAANRTLTAQQKELLKRWVADGATFQGHWSFETPVKPETPAAQAGHNEIDAFIVKRLAQDKLGLSPEADKPTLIRRVAFSLTGLPPSLEEQAEFLADASPEAYEHMVDRYLASPRYGEEMARHWLDVARYGDTHGLHLDNERQTWAYRDWVIQAFNDNKPFDKFTIEQLAGDLLPNPTVDQLVATGFSRCNVTTSEGGSISEEWVYRNALDRTSTMAQTFLGLTAGCAVCHDHKYDPITAKDYYSLYAFFHSAADPAMDGNVLLTAPITKLSRPEKEAQIVEFDKQITEKQKAFDEAAARIEYTDPATIEPRPEPSSFETVWLEDEVAAPARIAGSPGHPTTFVTAADGQVHSGSKALKRTDKGLSQDVIEGTPPLEIPSEGRLFAWVWFDAADAPRTLMLQYFKGGWLHRAVWGDYEAIQWGAAGTTERVLIGSLPEAGKWVKLEVEASRLGLKPGDQVTGFALTQFGGTVYWDTVGVAGRSDPAADPRRSLTAFRKQQTGKDTPGAAPEVNNLLKGPADKVLSAEEQKKLRDYYVQQVCLDTKAEVEPLAKELADLRKQRTDTENSIPGSFIFRDLPTPRESFVMLRGQYNKPGEKVEPGVPGFLPPMKREKPETRATRLDLANWLVDPDQPLMARVTVNRLWQQLYGVGLVKTSFDFGAQGEVPSHPDLLDWLAVTFRENGWDVKRLVKQMLMSATFRQSSVVSQELQKFDPENRLYARGPRFRLDAEQLRDNVLFVSGLMNFEMGGRGVHPYQPPNIWEPVGFSGSNTAVYVQDKGAALYRRSIYTFLKRTAPPPFMSNFDAPNREQPCTRRERSNTPLQALQLMNDVQHFEGARKLAERVLTEGGATPAERITFAYRVLLAREPGSEEIQIVSGLFEQELARYQANPEAAKKAITNGESAPKAGLNESELAAWTLVSNLLLNLDETLSRN